MNSDREQMEEMRTVCRIITWKLKEKRWEFSRCIEESTKMPWRNVTHNELDAPGLGYGPDTGSQCQDTVRLTKGMILVENVV
jgi:hypothetical protein